MMKLTKIITFSIISLIALTDLNADRVKKDLVTTKENEIITLLEKKIILIDKLIIEANIYNKETDPLIQKNFYNALSVFMTSAKRRNRDIFTHTQNRPEKKDKSKNDGRFSFSIAPSLNFGNPHLKRDIFNITMKTTNTTEALFKSNLNLVPILNHSLDNIQRSYYKKVDALLTSAYFEKLETPIANVLKKYIEIISLLGSNDMSQYLNNLKPLQEKKHNWAIYSRIFLFKFDLQEDDSFKKRMYKSSLLLDDTFKKLQAREDIILTTPSKYYDEKIDKDLRCLQTAKKVKYKGKICINSIDVDQGKYFDYGTFETKEHNFIYQNKAIFESLIKLDEELKKTSDKYLEYLLLKVKEQETAEIDKKPLDIQGGL